MPCPVSDEQISRIIEAILLPETWMDRVLASVHLVDQVEGVKQGRIQAEQALNRLGQVYLDGLLEPDEYRRRQPTLEEKLHTLVVPGVDAVPQTGKLLEGLPTLWGRADLGEPRKIMLTMLDGLYVDTVEEKAVVALRPKPAFRALFQIATTREVSGVILRKEKSSGPVP